MNVMMMQRVALMRSVGFVSGALPRTSAAMSSARTQLRSGVQRWSGAPCVAARKVLRPLHAAAPLKAAPRRAASALSMSSASLAAGTGGALLSAWRWYSASMVTNPITTKAITSAVLLLVSDLLAQRLSSDFRGRFDWARSLKQSVLGLVLLGPLGHFWFNVLERAPAVVGISAQLSSVATALKIAMDQLLMSPVINSVLFFYTEFLRGFGSDARSLSQRTEESSAKVRENLAPSVVAGWKLWPIAHLLTFAVVPLHLRILYVNVVSVGWLTFLSLSANRVRTGAVPA
mmetsp:Transcript_7855/g.20780  ORF Transcript_7855/g.20780 Transcript_7855/m.20780 type:complete len:288 (+) Transcript_7855:239-1102(+)